MTFDVKCYDLAKLFLEEEEGVSEKEIAELAAEIQQTIEDFLHFRKPEHRKP